MAFQKWLNPMTFGVVHSILPSNTPFMKPIPYCLLILIVFSCATDKSNETAVDSTQNQVIDILATQIEVKRQTKNEFKVLADSVYDEVLYQYENMAVLIFKEWQHIQDKGVEKKSVNSVLILLTRENSHWKVAADIIGQKPKTTFDK
jgi:hypothetical protein